MSIGNVGQGMMTFPNLPFLLKKPHWLDAKVTVPKEAPVGSVYYLHIVQSISNTVTGGYTVVIVVV